MLLQAPASHSGAVPSVHQTRLPSTRTTYAITRFTAHALTNWSFQPTHLQYIISAANLRAFNYGLRGESDSAIFKKVADEVIVPEFTPKSGVKVQINDNDPVPQGDAGGDGDQQESLKQLPPPSSLVGYRLNPVEFEKDDDTNFHIDFITAASNLRALNYNIAPATGIQRSKSPGRSSLPSPPPHRWSPVSSVWSSTRFVSVNVPIPSST